MLHKTKAIILKKLAYGDTSLIVTAYTEMFGLQSYLVKGGRKVAKNGSSTVSYFQPAALLDLVVYHNELKNLQTIREIKWSYLYENTFSKIRQNAVALFMVELLTKCLREPETNEILFAFAEQYLLLLDAADPEVVANLPLHYILHLAGHLGFRMDESYSNENHILDLKEGIFTSEFPAHGLYLDGLLSQATHQLLQMDNPITLYRLKLGQNARRQLLKAYEKFYLYHLTDFGYLKTLPVLEEVLSA